MRHIEDRRTNPPFVSLNFYVNKVRMTNMWDCHFCNALNEDTKAKCWKCERSRIDSDLASGKDDAAMQVRRQQIEAAALEKRQLIESVAAREAQTTLDVRTFLTQFLGSEVGMNVRDPSKVVSTTLRSVQADHFAVEYDGLLVRTPYSQIIRVSSPVGGGALKAGIFGGSYNLVIEVFHLIIYKGSVGVGVSIPI
jgi:hypothetical protein